MPNGLAITRAERAFFASEGTDAARVSGCIGGGFIAVLGVIVPYPELPGLLRHSLASDKSRAFSKC